MSGLSAVSDGATKFTDEMLAKNFISIANGFDDFEKYLGHLEGHINELSKSVQTLVAKTPKVSKVKPFVFGAVVGVAVYRYVKANAHKPIVAAVNNMKDEAEQRVTESVDKIQNKSE